MECVIFSQMMNTSNCGQNIIILLSPVDEMVISYLVSTFSHKANFVGLCTRQNLLQNHLTPRENLQLTAFLNGYHDEARIDELLTDSRLLDVADREPVYTLPRLSRQILGLLAALLPDPDILLIDDLTSGLSLPAKRFVWQFIQAEQKRRPRTIFYCTPDLNVISFLGDQIWLVEDGRVRMKWSAGEISDVLPGNASFAIELNSLKATKKFRDSVKKLNTAIYDHHPGNCVVEVFVKKAEDIVTLTWMAGFDLVSFRSLPLQVDHLPEGWYQDTNQIQQLKDFSNGIDHSYSETHLSSPQIIRAIFHIALVEWKKHFRSFWKAGNLLLTGIILLEALSLLFINLDNFSRAASLPLLLSSALSLGFGIPTLSQLLKSGEFATLFHASQPQSRTSPLSSLTLLDLSLLNRSHFLIGWLFGQFALVLIHSWPMLFYFWAIIDIFATPAPVFWGSIVYWGLMASTSLAFTVLLSARLPSPRWGTFVGWSSWLAIVISSQLPLSWSPFIWLWPPSGYTIAFRRILEHGMVWPPLLLAFCGSIMTFYCAYRTFNIYPSIWSDRDNEKRP